MPYQFDPNKYKNIFDQSFGAGAYDKGIQQAQNIGRLKSQVAIAQKQYKAQQKASQKKTYNDAVAYWSDPANKSRLQQDGAYRAVENIKNDPNAQAAIKSQGYNVTDYTNAMYAAASGGKFRSQREYNQFAGDLKKTTDAKNKAKDKQYQDKYGMNYQDYYDSQKKTQAQAKAQPQHKSGNGLLGFLDNLKNQVERNTAKVVDSAGLGIPDWLAHHTPKGLKDLSLPLAPGINLSANSLIKSETPSKTTAGKVMDTLSSGAGYLVPGEIALKGAKLLKAGTGAERGLKALGAGSKLAKIGKIGAEGATAGGLFGTGQQAVDASLHPNDATFKQRMATVGFDMGLGLVGDPLLHGAGSLLGKALGRGKLPNVMDTPKPLGIEAPKIAGYLNEGQKALPGPMRLNEPMSVNQPVGQPFIQGARREMNPYTVKFEQLVNDFNGLQAQGKIPAGKEYEVATEMWSHMAGPQDPSFEQMLHLANDRMNPNAMQKADLIQQARKNQKAPVYGVNNITNQVKMNQPMQRVPLQYVGKGSNPVLRAQQVPKEIPPLNFSKKILVGKNHPDVVQRVQQAFKKEVAATKAENISPMKNGGSLKRLDSSQVNTPKQEEKILLSQTKPPFDLKRRLNRVYQNTFDTQHLIGGISNDVKVHASNARQTQGITDFIAEHGLVNKEGKKIGVSLKELAQSIPLNKEEDFWRYMAHQHNIARSKEGKNVFSQFNAADSEKVAKELLAKHPEFKQAAKKVNGWINTFMDTWAKDTVGEDKLKLWRKMYPDYIPVYRETDPLKQTSFNGAKRGFVNQHNLVKKAQGAKADLSSNLKDPLGNIVQLVNKTVKAQRNNEVGKSILDEVKKGGLDDLFEVVKTKPSEDITKVLKDGGIEGVMDKLTGQFEDVFKQAEKGNNIVKVMDNGNEVLLKVKDLDYLKALQSLSDGTGQSAAEQFEKAARKVARPIKELITGKNPLFAVFNIMRDTPTAFIQGAEKNPIKFANRYMKALNEISHNSKGFQEFAAQGGMQSGFFKNDVLKTTTKLKNAKTPFEKLMNKVEGFNNLTEATPRYMEYLATLEKGGTKSQAIYNAAEVTTNFARSGKWGKFFDSFVLYLNPALQGLDKFVRQVTNKNTRLGTVLKAGGVVTIPQVATELVNKDNPNYKSLDQRVKDDFFLIPNQFGKKDAKGNPETFFRIPKTREYSVVFSVLTNRIGEMMRGKSAKDASKGVLGSLDRNFSVPTRPIWSPFSDVARNKDWKGAPINSLGMTLDNRSNYLKYDERTSEIGKYLSKALNSQPIDGLKYSPKDIDYLIQSYTGIIGDVLLPAATKTGSVSGIPQKKFIADSVYSNQSVNDFYDNLQKLRKSASDKNILGNIPGGATTKEEMQRNRLNKISNTISKLNTNIRQTTNEEQQRKLRKQIIQLSQQGNTLYSQYKGR